MSTRSTTLAGAWRARGVVILVIVALAPHRAVAERLPLPAAARALFDDGNAAMTRRDPATAAVRYRAAWDEAPDARIAINLGIALAELGRIAAAAEAFAIYLADPASDPAKRPVIGERLDRWRAELGELTLDVTPAAAHVTIDGNRPLRGAPGTRVPVAPGSHAVSAHADGFRPGDVIVTVAAGETAVAHVTLAPAIAPAAIAPVPAPVTERTPARPWKWIALGAGAAAAAAGSYFGIVALDDWHTVHERCPEGACTSPADLVLADDARQAGTRANLAFGAAGVALVAAFVLWRTEPRRRTVVSIAPRMSGGMLCLSGAL